MTKRQPRLKSFEDDRVKEAARKLIQRGVPWEVLQSLLAIIPGASDKHLELVPGFQERTLRKLPDQIND